MITSVGFVLSLISLFYLQFTPTSCQNFFNTHASMGGHYFAYKWPNGSNIVWYPERNNTPHSGGAIDCFGIGKTAATGLEWFFRNNNSNSLDVRFFLSSRRNPRRMQVLVGPQFGLEWTDFSIQRKTVIIVHGFLSHGHEDWIHRMEEAFHRWGNVNVIVVDWSAHGNTWNYYKAAVNARIVGQEISKFLSHIVNATREQSVPEASWAPIHMVGHSLGAHICGITADYFKNYSTPWEIKRITGLDPAQPCFRVNDLSLNKRHAPLVDVIHTNGKLFSSIGLGLPDPIGHMDFYPNGGKRQPACINIETSAFDYLGIPKSAVEQAICSHGFSHAYFIQSISSAASGGCHFCGHSWDLTCRHAQQIINGTSSLPGNCVEMGLNAENFSLRGSFFVMTSNTTPFCDVSSRDRTQIARRISEDFAGQCQD
uniref:phospholipase A1 n=1 Tax=Fopius arisanus TaxID=64838 RepID=A0A0C9RDL8_9HYME